MPVASRLISCLVPLLLSGCALSYSDGRGGITHLGLMVYREHHTGPMLATSIKTLGLALDTTAESGGMNLGYRSVTNLSLAEDASIDFALQDDNSLEINSFERHRISDTTCQAPAQGELRSASWPSSAR